MTPEEIRKHATTLILDHARDIEFLTIHEHFYNEDMELDEAEADKAANAIADLIRKAEITVSFPTDQPAA